MPWLIFLSCNSFSEEIYLFWTGCFLSLTAVLRALYFFGFMFCSHCAIHLLRFPKYFFLIIYSIFKTFQYVTFILFCRAEYSKICQRVPWGGPQFVIWGHSVPDTAVGEHLRHLGHRDTGTLGHWDTLGPKRTAQQPIRIHFGLKPKVKEKEKTRKRKQGKVGGNQMEKSSLCVGSLGANLSSFVHLV